MFSFTPKKGDPELLRLGIHSENYRNDYVKVAEELNRLIRADLFDEYYQIIRTLGRDDFFFFCYFVLKLPVNEPFILARILEIEKDPYNYIDLWAREHFKSTILTFALTIWELIKNPEERVCIFSHTRVIAKAHLRRIKFELQNNVDLKTAWDDIFYYEPEKEAPKWSEDDGIYVKRKGTYVEASVEAWGLVDGMPTSKHFTIRIYDDIITEKSVGTKLQIDKVTDCFRLSENLGTRGGKKRIIGTRYSMADTYSYILKMSKIKKRLYPAEVDSNGEFAFNGTPVLLTREELVDKFEIMGEYIYSAQMGQKPMAKSEQRFKYEFLRFYDDLDKVLPYLNLYIVVDPASTKKKRSDYTVIIVFGVDSRRNYYIVDMVRDKLNLGERWDRVTKLVQKYGIMTVGYERIGLTSDIDYFEERMSYSGIFYTMVELGSQVPKHQRISNLMPLFMNRRIIIPRVLGYVDLQGGTHDLINEFIYEEYIPYPYSEHDDMLDDLAGMTDSRLKVEFPTIDAEHELRKPKFDPYSDNSGDGRSWMSA